MSSVQGGDDSFRVGVYSRELAEYVPSRRLMHNAVTSASSSAMQVDAPGKVAVIHNTTMGSSCHTEDGPIATIAEWSPQWLFSCVESRSARRASAGIANEPSVI